MTTLFDQLNKLLTDADPVLLWTSESDRPIEAVQLPCKFDLSEWEKVGDGYELLRVASYNQSETPTAEVWHDLRKLFWNTRATAYKKPTGAPSEYELLILVRVGLCLNTWVGIKTTTIES